MEDEITAIINKAITDNVFPGCVVGVVSRREDNLILPFGAYTYESDARRVEKDTVYDVASITKSIPTAALALKLIDDGKLRVTDRLSDYVPEVQNQYRESILIQHLLTQSLDFSTEDAHFRLSAHKDKQPEEILQIIFTTALSSKPGEKFFYTNASSILLGIVIERICQDTLDNLANKYFFEPLGMKKTTFHPESLPKEAIVPTEYDPWRNRLIQGEVHDESAFVLRQKMIAGSAGLFSTAPDLLTFMEMVVHRGKFRGTPYFSEEIITQMYTNQISRPDQYTGLGWELYQPRYMGQYASKATIGKTGFTGCVVLCDMEKGIAFVLLSNYTYPQRKPDATMIHLVRRNIADVVFGQT